MLTKLERIQEAVDRFYEKHGPCCAGCDWWVFYNPVIGECTRHAPVSAEERMGALSVKVQFNTFSSPEAGHIHTERDHLCGDFKDEG